MDETNKRPIPWMVATGICAVLAIGFAIWAFSLKSDRDDTQAALERSRAALADEQGQLSEEERSAAETEAKQQAFGEKFQSRYKAVRDRFIAEEKQADDLKGDVTKEKQELATSQQQVQQADSAEAALRAQVNARVQQRQLAGACARSAVSALDSFLNAASVRAGANQALKRLEDLQDECEEVVKEAPAS